MLSAADHLAMHAQGYCLRLHDDEFRLERIPASRLFKDDAAAWLHVFDMAHADDGLALRALEFLREHGPFEFGLVGRYAAIYRREALLAHAE